MDRNIDWNRIMREHKQIMITLPGKMGSVMVNFSKDRFIANGWADAGFEPWDPRNAKAKRNKGRALLIDSGRLRRSIRITRTTSASVTIGSDVPYAQAHNDGFDGTQTVRSHSRTKTRKVAVYSIKTHRKSTTKANIGSMYVRGFDRHMKIPRRRFMGPSFVLNDKLSFLIDRELKKAFK